MLAMVSMFIATTAFAASYGTSGFEGQNALNNPPTVTGQFTVYLSVKSNSIDGVAISRHRLPITMGTPGVTNYFFVSDVLVAAMSQYPALSFQNSSGIPITSTSSYVQKVTDSTVSSTLVFEPVTGINYYNGWMFRINDKYRAMNPADWPAGWDEDVSGPMALQLIRHLSNQMILLISTLQIPPMPQLLRGRLKHPDLPIRLGLTRNLT